VARADRELLIDVSCEHALVTNSTHQYFPAADTGYIGWLCRECRTAFQTRTGPKHAEWTCPGCERRVDAEEFVVGITSLAVVPGPTVKRTFAVLSANDAPPDRARSNTCAACGREYVVFALSKACPDCGAPQVAPPARIDPEH
jgi:predicted RNA-binding Zn-ribbon protein involved in translation (DUF1610 family)